MYYLFHGDVLDWQRNNHEIFLILSVNSSALTSSLIFSGCGRPAWYCAELWSGDSTQKHGNSMKHAWRSGGGVINNQNRKHWTLSLVNKDVGVLPH